MKQKELEKLKDLSLQELRVKEAELRQELFTQRLHSATKPVKDNQSAKKLRKNIARVLTVVHLKQSNIEG